MADQSKTYWRGAEELTNETGFVRNAQEEFPALSNPSHAKAEGNQSLDGLSAHRRDFLKVMGFSLAAASLAACEAPVKKAIPLLNKPEEYDPGIANWYASSYVDGSDYCPILVKTREGRPVKIEGNTLSSLTSGGTSARAQASVLGLYNTERYKSALKGDKPVSWSDADAEITAELAKIAAAGGQIRIVSSTVFSPTAKKAVSDFLAKYPTAKHIQYDANSSYGILKAAKASFGAEFIPGYNFQKAKVVVSLGADFLGTWISPTQYAKAWSRGRKVSKAKKEMSRLYAFESIMSLTGANADYRTAVRPSEEGLYAAALYNEVAKATGAATISVPAPANIKNIAEAAKDLLSRKGESLVVSGSNDANVQTVVFALNNLLGNIGTTLDTDSVSYQKQGNDEAMAAFVAEAGNVSAVIFWNANPVYDHPACAAIKDAVSKVSLSISLSEKPDETAAVCKFKCPDNHFLESWGDAEPKKGYYSFMQPAITPLFKTRQAPESLLVWAGNNTDYYSYLQDNWKATIYPQQKEYGNFRDFWNYSLHDGIFEVGKFSFRKTEDNAAEEVAPAKGPAFTGNVADVASAIAASNQPGANYDLVIYESIGLGTGKYADNPWLQEFPDPISRSCWENFVSIPMATAKELGVVVNEGETTMLEVKVGGKSFKLPALVQPGQNKNTIAIAYGYGREVVGRAGKDVGYNAFRLATQTGASVTFTAVNATLAKTGETTSVAHVQTHHTIMGRDIIQESTLAQYEKDPAAGHVSHLISTPEGPTKATDISMWNRHERPNHAWGMSIDLNSCIGCGACVIGCQAENNVPVVGKQEVINRREMHWIRIDRYYSSDAKKGDYAGLEEASDNPEVVFQPLMCQHCNNAPCETVCPVAATTHSTEGLNQMTYNRCIGTRYCANNCPYKVRRFNWFSYPDNEQFNNNPSQSDLGRMVLNPDVMVRARGVIEKCSMCVQRIQEGKLNAKKEGRRPVDGEISTACAQACPTDAITFGDMNDADSRIAKVIEDEYEQRAYRILEEINTNPSVSYLTKIRNKA